MSAYSLLDQLRARAEAAPMARAVVRNGRVTTRQDLARRCAAIAVGLRSTGLEPGDRVLFAVRPSASAIALLVGITEAGGVIAPLDAGMGDVLFERRMALLAPRWVVAESILLAASGNRIVRWLLARRGLAVPDLRRLPGVRFVRVGPPLPGAPPALAAAALERASGERDATSRQPDAPAFIVCTSGTTAAPRAVVHTWRSMRAVLDNVATQLSLCEHDVLCAADLHLVLPALFAGATVVLPPHRASPARFLAELAGARVTHAFVVTAECRRLVEYCERRRRRFPATLGKLLIGGAPVRVPLLSRLRAVLAPSTAVSCVYGMTEILPVAQASLDAKLAYRGEGDLLGELVPGVAARVSDEGELVLSGPNLCAGYLGEPPMREHATGDLVRIDNGRLVLLGRRKDMIIRGATNIYPELYEPAVEHIPGVRRCAMVGLYDEGAADERLVLVVEPEAGADAGVLASRVRRALRTGPARIDGSAQPDDVLVMTLPEGGRSGKIDKRKLRELVRPLVPCVSR